MRGSVVLGTALVLFLLLNLGACEVQVLTAETFGVTKTGPWMVMFFGLRISWPALTPSAMVPTLPKDGARMEYARPLPEG